MTETDEDESRSRRRLALLLLVLLVVVLGAGIGTLTLLDSNQAEPTTTPVDDTDPAPTPSGDGTPAPPAEESPDATPDGGPDGPAATPEGPADTPEDGTPPDTGDGTPEETPESGGGGEAGGGSDTPPETAVDVSLTAAGDATLLSATDVYPGDGGVERLTLRNAGDRAGRVRLATTTVLDRENGLVGPEASVDDSPNNGELSRALSVRLYFEYPDGENVTVVGNASDRVPLRAVENSTIPRSFLGPGESVTVTLDWQVQRGAGNEIQSDGTVFDAVFELRVPET